MIAAAVFVTWLGTVKGVLDASGVSARVAQEISTHAVDLLRLFKSEASADGAAAWLENRVMGREAIMEAPDAEPVQGEDDAVVTLGIKTTPEVAIRLTELYETGLYGHSLEEVAERVVCLWLQDRDTVSRD